MIILEEEILIQNSLTALTQDYLVLLAELFKR